MSDKRERRIFPHLISSIVPPLILYTKYSIAEAGKLSMKIFPELLFIFSPMYRKYMYLLCIKLNSSYKQNCVAVTWRLRKSLEFDS